MCRGKLKNAISNCATFAYEVKAYKYAASATMASTHKHIYWNDPRSYIKFINIKSELVGLLLNLQDQNNINNL